MPSQGSHFFHNLNSFHVGYFTVGSDERRDFIDWDWLAGQPAAESGRFVRYIQLQKPIAVLMSGHQGRGIILKPEANRAGS